MGTVHIQHIVQCGGGHPHGEILLPGLLVQVREVGIGLAFIGKGIEVCVGIILGQQEIGQLVALLVHRPQGVVGLVVIGQRATGNDELLAHSWYLFYRGVKGNRCCFHMGIVFDVDGAVITVSKQSCLVVFSPHKNSTIIHNQFSILAQTNCRIGILHIGN